MKRAFWQAPAPTILNQNIQFLTVKLLTQSIELDELINGMAFFVTIFSFNFHFWDGNYHHNELSFEHETFVSAMDKLEYCVLINVSIHMQKASVYLSPINHKSCNTRPDILYGSRLFVPFIHHNYSIS